MLRLLALAMLMFGSISAIAMAEEPAPQKEDPAPNVDVAKTTDRIVQQANEAGKRLGAKDPGADTQRLQRDVLRDIESLIRKAQEPPPPSNNSSSSPNGMQQGIPDPKKGESTPSSSPSSNRKERREKTKSSTNNPIPPKEGPETGSNPKIGPGSTNGSPSPNELKGYPPRIPDVYKDVWGHLPEKMRQEMDLYFREQFMPRYSEMLKQYYSSLAERENKKP